jgi:hypothetical protein
MCAVAAQDMSRLGMCGAKTACEIMGDWFACVKCERAQLQKSICDGEYSAHTGFQVRYQ